MHQLAETKTLFCSNGSTPIQIDDQCWITHHASALVTVECAIELAGFGVALIDTHHMVDMKALLDSSASHIWTFTMNW